MRDILTLFERLWRELPVYLFAMICGAVVFGLWASHNNDYDLARTSESFTIFYVCALIMVFIDVIWTLLRRRPASPIAFVRGRYLSGASLLHVLGSVPILILCATIVPIFSSIKSMIPLLNSYSWDATFIAWDRTLFFGRDAWQVLQPVLGHPYITAGLALVYHLWILLVYPGCIYLALYSAITPDIRRQFFLAYVMCWSLIGGAMATHFASFGPAFVKPLAGIDTFANQLAYLRAANDQIPVMTLNVQDMLLARFMAGDDSLGSGISAMPSMHVAIAALYWLAMREISPRAGRAFGVFVAVIWIASVHLAYHYAVDGLVSLIAVWGVWTLARALLKRWDRIAVPFVQPALRTNTVPTE